MARSTIETKCNTVRCLFQAVLCLAFILVILSIPSFAEQHQRRTIGSIYIASIRKHKGKSWRYLMGKVREMMRIETLVKKPGTTWLVIIPPVTASGKVTIHLPQVVLDTIGSNKALKDLNGSYVPFVEDRVLLTNPTGKKPVILQVVDKTGSVPDTVTENNCYRIDRSYWWYGTIKNYCGSSNPSELFHQDNTVVLEPGTKVTFKVRWDTSQYVGECPGLGPSHGREYDRVTFSIENSTYTIRFVGYSTGTNSYYQDWMEAIASIKLFGSSNKITVYWSGSNGCGNLHSRYFWYTLSFANNGNNITFQTSVRFAYQNYSYTFNNSNQPVQITYHYSRLSTGWFRGYYYIEKNYTLPVRIMVFKDGGQVK